ncbi:MULTISPECIES: hypothetical protein [Methylocaldum]|jgi:hypothetical protein|uniref:hypothetical protein n=1 Tax=Methylocaldum sp. 14B TaxID=1912213 RepID=UPI00098A5D1F|nr:hypothetical protein [Methylocaldum sp. 14B]
MKNSGANAYFRAFSAGLGGHGLPEPDREARIDSLNEQINKALELIDLQNAEIEHLENVDVDLHRDYMAALEAAQGSLRAIAAGAIRSRLQ